MKVTTDREDTAGGLKIVKIFVKLSYRSRKQRSRILAHFPSSSTLPPGPFERTLGQKLPQPLPSSAPAPINVHFLCRLVRTKCDTVSKTVNVALIFTCQIIPSYKVVFVFQPSESRRLSPRCSACCFVLFALIT